MATIAVIGGAIVKALAFSGSNDLFSKIDNSDVDEERERHDKAMEQTQAFQAEYSWYWPPAYALD